MPIPLSRIDVTKNRVDLSKDIRELTRIAGPLLEEFLRGPGEFPQANTGSFVR